MYDLNQIKRGLSDPRAVGREFSRLCHTRGGRYRFNPRGTGIFELDWDTLIILDACRYDMFADVADLPGTTDARYSLAPATYEFVRANFSETRLADTIYLGAINWFLRLRDEIGAEVFKTVDLQSDEADIEWADEELNVPAPSAVTGRAKTTQANHPNKRLIVHYLQPHHPFIGPTGSERFTHQSSSLLDVVAESSASDETLREAYRENLRIVLQEVEELLGTLDGRTVVTADHGEMLSDRHRYAPVKGYGHHVGIFNDPTTKVPMHVHESGDRRQIRASEPKRTGSKGEKRLNERLRNLGYKV